MQKTERTNYNTKQTVTYVDCIHAVIRIVSSIAATHETTTRLLLGFTHGMATEYTRKAEAREAPSPLAYM